MIFIYLTLIFTLILSSSTSLSAALHPNHLNDEIKSDGSDVKNLLPTQSHPTPDPTKPLPIPVKTLLLPTTQILYPANQRPLNIRTRFSFPCRRHRFRAGSAREIGSFGDAAEVIGHRHVAEREEKVKLNGFLIPMKMIRHRDEHHHHHHDGNFEVKEGVGEDAWKLMMRHRRHHHHDDDDDDDDDEHHEHHHDDDDEHHEHHHHDDDEHHEHHLHHDEHHGHHHHDDDEHHEHHHHEGIFNKIRKFLTHF